MSTLIVANVYFESTANNRIQYTGSNGINIYLGGNAIATINTTAMVVNGYISTTNTPVSAKTDSYTLTGTDSGTLLTVSNTSTKTITVPASLPVGFRCVVYQLNTGNVVIGNAAGVTLNSRTGSYTSSTRYGAVTVFVYAANSVIVDGSI
jgi:hypothetical protein